MIWVAAAVVAVLLVGLPLLLLGSGREDPDQTVPTTGSSTSVAGETSTSAGSSTTAGETSTTGVSSTTAATVTSTTSEPANSGEATTTSEPLSTTTTLPGEAFDIGPAAGDVVAVVGVAHDDVLNVRELPGTSYGIVTMLDPLADDVVATGRHRLLTSSIWDEVKANGVTGWVNSRYLGYLGGVDDLTSFVVSTMGGIPEAETMLELGTMVAESFDPGEGGFAYAMSVAPAVGDLGEVTFDVIGLLDDAQLGWRLHVLGQLNEGGEGFILKSVEATALCGRGVTEDGLCV